MKLKSLKIFVAYFAIYIVWGTTYLAIRFAIDTIPPFLMMGARFLFAGIFLFIISSLSEYVRPSAHDIKQAAVAGFLTIFFGYSTLSWAQQYINSGLASLILATIPIWMVSIDWLVLKGIKPDRLTILGIVLGMIGVVLITKVDEKSFFNPSVTPELAIITCVITLSSALSFAIGSLYVKRVTISISVFSFISLQTIIGGIALYILGILSGELDLLSIENISSRSLLSLFYLIFIGTLIAHSSYFWLLRVSTPAKVASYAFFNPVVAVLLGWLIAEEQLYLKLILGMITILIAILLINRPFSQINIRNIIKIKTPIIKELK